MTEDGLQAETEIDPDDNDMGFGIDRLGFPTERRPCHYRRTMLEEIPEGFEEWFNPFSDMVGEQVTTHKQLHAVKRLIATWRDLFVSDIRQMPQTDLISHRIPTYRNAIPRVSKPVLYTDEETKWQRDMLPKLVAAGVITQCESPWAAKTRFVRKENGSLRMVHVFCGLNEVTVKSNYPMKRIEPVLRAIAQPWVRVLFKCDGLNGYWAIPMFLPHAYKLGISTALGQFCYLVMGQGCTGGPATYSRLKDIMTNSVPSPDEEPALNEAMPGKAIFEHFVDDDFGGAETVEDLITFLHQHYFPRLAWAKLTLNPAKCRFFVGKVGVLGHQRDRHGIRPSEKKLAAYEHWPTPTSKEELIRFCNGLPFLQAFIEGRADKVAFLKTAIVEEIITTRINQKQTTKRKAVDFCWTSEHQRVFDELKTSICQNACTGADDTIQYHLSTDASKTGAGGVLFQLRNQPAGTVMTREFLTEISVVMFMSFRFTDVQTRYHATEREALAVLKAVEEARWLLKGSPTLQCCTPTTKLSSRC